jgi:hypothetical protein
MDLQEMWVHGTTATIEWPGGAGLEFSGGHRMDQVRNHAWTDIVGLRQGGPTIVPETSIGAAFRGNDNETNSFHFSVPTPSLRTLRDRETGKTRHTTVRLSKVYLLYQAAPNVRVQQIELADGPRRGWSTIVVDRLAVNRNGSRGRADLVEGETQFSLAEDFPVLFAVCIAAHVKFENLEAVAPGTPRDKAGLITFTAAGAEFVLIDRAA